MNLQSDPHSLAVMKFGIGQPVPRTEDTSLVRGKGCYTEDVKHPGAPLLHDAAPGNVALDYHYGDAGAVADAFAKAAHVTNLKLVNSRVVVNAIEPRAAIGVYESKTGRFTLHVPSQGVFGMKGN